MVHPASRILPLLTLPAMLQPMQRYMHAASWQLPGSTFSSRIICSTHCITQHALQSLILLLLLLLLSVLAGIQGAPGPQGPEGPPGPQGEQ